MAGTWILRQKRGPMKNEQTVKLAENLERLMKSKGLTITAVATKIGMNKSTLHNYCNGVVPRNLVKIKELADLFGVSLSSLLFGEEKQSSTEISGSGIEGRFEVVIRRIEKTVK